MVLLYQLFFISLNMETTEKKKCKSCKKFTSYHWSLVAISFYILFAAVYGTIKLVNEISQLF
jgi:hypothetical protein